MDPCAGVDCAIGYRCMVDGASGTGYCEPSCDLYNGGCAGDQQCVLKQVECFTTPCPPVVECVQLQGTVYQYLIAYDTCILTSDSILLPFPQSHHVNSGWIVVQESTTALLMVTAHHLTVTHRSQLYMLNLYNCIVSLYSTVKIHGCTLNTIIVFFFVLKE